MRGALFVAQNLSVALPTLLMVAVMAFAPHVYPLMQPDSYGYTGFYPNRSAIYPLFIQGLQTQGLSLEAIAAFQSALLVASFIFLLLTLQKHVLSTGTLLLFGILYSGNIYLVQGQLTILTESLTLPLSNILIACLVIAAKRPNRLYLWLGIGVICGLGMAIRPAFIALIVGTVLALPFFLSIRTFQFYRYMGAIIAGSFFALTLESLLYFSYHDSRNSLAGLVLFGKAAIISTDSSYDDTFDDGPLDILENSVISAYRDATAWRQEEGNLFRRVTLLSDLEVYAQYQLLNDEISEISIFMNETPQEVMADYGRSVLINNPIAYFKTSGLHYVGLWTIGALLALDALGVEPDVPAPSILPTMGQEADVVRPESLIAVVIFPSFLLMGTLVFCLTIALLFRWLKVIANYNSARPSLHERLCAAMVSLGQSHLVIVAFVNVANPRYMLSSYPFLLLALVILLQYTLRIARSRPSLQDKV